MLAKWTESKSLSYSLLSDPSSKLIKALGAFAAPASWVVRAALRVLQSTLLML